MDRMKSAIMILDFFKKINGFEKEPEAKHTGCEQNNGQHFYGI